MVQIAGLDDPDFTDRYSALQQSMLQTKRNQMNVLEKYCILLSPRPERFEASGVGTTRGTSANMKELDPFLTDTQQAVLLEPVRRPKATYNGLAAEIGVSRRTVSRAIAALVDREYIERVGNNISGFWEIIR
ncbi:winged helix-turn-helix transcriptional regulator [Murdochiella massiliensis]|uniref:winged helix-turn-helix transcriptional regulator n=1 Tax=Murdochiella massiliensis TaxID=1673723 RepID=UPI0008306919|nr:helix-turn-helix domain-containing protein [Murdochiella massiliensis]